MIIQTILLDPSGAIWTDEAPNVSRLDPSGAIQVDAEHPTRNRKVAGSNPSSGSKSQISGLARLLWLVTPLSSLAALIWSHHNPLGAPPGC
jgi:hypothetical protein